MHDRMARLSDEDEARELLTRRTDELIELGYQGLRARLGRVRRSWLGGRIKFREVGEDVVEDFVAPSGIPYQFEILVHEERDGGLHVTVEILEEATVGLGKQLVESFDITADGRVSRY